jgi:hypothetical protein
MLFAVGCSTNNETPNDTLTGGTSPLFIVPPSDVTVRAAGLTAIPLNSTASEMGGTQVTVSGSGAVELAPDMARISAGISTRDMDATKAMAENNDLMNALIAAVKALGIDEDDIRTQHFSVHPSYDWSSSSRRFMGYEVSNNVSITIRDISKVGLVLGAVTAEGATSVGGVQFMISDSTAAYHTALALAVQDAAGRAQAIAGSLGMTAVVAVSIHEGWGNHQPVARNFEMADMAMAAPMAGGGGWDVPVQTGELSVTANVTVTFSLQ